MHIAFSCPHGAQRRTQIGSNRIQERFAKGESSGGIPNERGKYVSLLQTHAHGRAESLLSAPQINPAVNQTGPVEAGQFIIQRSRQEHPSIGRDKQMGIRGGFGQIHLVCCWLWLCHGRYYNARLCELCNGFFRFQRKSLDIKQPFCLILRKP